MKRLWLVAALLIAAWAVARAQTASNGATHGAPVLPLIRADYPARLSGPVVMAGYCEEDSTVHAIRVDRHGYVILSREGQ